MKLVPGGAIEGFARATGHAGAWVEEHLAGAGRVHVDVGGEGRYPGAINVNPMTQRPAAVTRFAAGAQAWEPIPLHVRATAEALPIADHVVNTLTLESAPIRAGAASEIARVLAPGGEVFLLNPSEYADAGAHQSVIDAIRGAIVERVHDTESGIAITHLTAPR